MSTGFPIIGVTPDLKPEGIVGLRKQYLDSVIRAGGVALVFPFGLSETEMDSAYRACDGLLITGGADVAPELYGEERRESCGFAVKERDELELYMAKRAYGDGKPVLGICRGMQVMNVSRGGTLYQDIPEQLGIPVEKHRQVEDYDVEVHDVVFEEGAYLRELLGAERIRVNTKHHQSVKNLGEGLVINGVCPDDGVVEAFHDPNRDFFVGVQWHPEMLSHFDPHATKLFEALVVHAAAFRDRT